jgi:hypothetical protein
MGCDFLANSGGREALAWCRPGQAGALLINDTTGEQMSKKKAPHCAYCEKPDPDVTKHVGGEELPFHAGCWLESEREARAFWARIHDALAEALVRRFRDSGPCDGVLPRADEIF